jgi:very-short-patch-repair endonuclease
VPNGFKTPKKTNETEAEHIASIICTCIENQQFKGKTIGVISLLGHEQAYEIERLLQVNLDPKEYEKRRIQCGTPSQFQGDERDIIFLSVVEGPSEKGGPVRLLSEDGRNDMTRKRYNVAASRAKDQMWVVHSLNPEIDLKPDDIRLRLIKHAMNPSVDKNEEKLKTAESDFEKQVMNMLLNQGYRVTPQWNVGAYRIDMVVEDGEKRVALECDGEWHTQDDLPNDLKRQAILERLGWKFIRVRGSAFYRHPEGTMQWVFDELESHGIRPNFASFEETAPAEGSVNHELLEHIKRRAEQIRREWYAETSAADEKSTGEQTTKSQDYTGDQTPPAGEDIAKQYVKPDPTGSPSVAKNSKAQKATGADVEQPKISVSRSKDNKEKMKTGEVVKEKPKNENSVKPTFDFRQRHGMTGEKPVAQSNKSKNNIKKGTKSEAGTVETKQQPLFDFRKK